MHSKLPLAKQLQSKTAADHFVGALVGLFFVLFGATIASAQTEHEHQGARYLVNAPLVELFTSQSCPNCPVADRTLGQIVEDGEALALSIHVDYWDYTGWKDPFGTTQNTQRQLKYKERLDVPYVFTPQFVLNGRLVMESQAVSGLHMAVKMFSREGAPVIPVLEYGDEVDIVRLPNMVVERSVVVKLVYFKPPMVSVPSSGRNSGKELFNAHSVTDWQDLGEWTGQGRALELGCRDMYGCALILSDAETLEVLSTVARINPEYL